MMNEKALWKYFLDNQVSASKPFDRRFVWIEKENFEPVQIYFTKEFNILHPDKSYRSQGYFLHIQAIDQGEYVFVHRDVGNLAKFWPLGIIHLFVDVVPYIILAWVKGVPFRSLFSRPQ